MSKFKFRYEKILSLKKEYEGEAKNNLAVEIQKLIIIKKKLNSVLIEKVKYFKFIQEKISLGVSGGDLNRINKNKEYYYKKIENIKFDIKEKEKDILIRRKELKKAVIETKKYEKLKEKYFDEFMDELNINERKEIDEIVNFKNYKMSGD